MNTLTPVDGFADAPFLHEYFGVWCVTEDGAQAIYHAAMRLDLARHVAERQHVVRQQTDAHRMAAGDDGPSYYRTSLLSGGIAVVQVGGTLMKQASSMGNDTSTVRLRQTMRGLARDDRVSGVMMVMESPGGTVAGTMDLAADVAALAAVKPVHVYADGLMASAAYWVGSQASVVSAGPDAIVGSIGTFATVYDLSGMMAKEGIKVYTIRRGEFKGTGVPGTEITEPQRAEMQRTVDALNEHFIAGVSAGRRVPIARARELNDGRVHVGAAAKEAGLVDHVENFDAAMSRLRSATTTKTKHRGANAAAGLLIAAGDTMHGDGATAVAEPPASAGATTEVHVSATNNGTAPEQAERTSTPPQPSAQTNPAPAPASAATSTAAPAPAAATAAEIDAACPNASSDFKFEAMKRGLTVAKAKDEFIGWQSAQIRSRDEDLTKLKASHTTDLKAKDDQITELKQRLHNAGGLAASTATEQQPKQAEQPADPKLQAEQEWEANFEACQGSFVKKDHYVAYRSNEIRKENRRRR